MRSSVFPKRVFPTRTFYVPVLFYISSGQSREKFVEENLLRKICREESALKKTAMTGKRRFEGRLLVRAGGVEPPRLKSQRILSPMRLPFRHARTLA
jgi:hypothetical protein